MRLLWFLVAIMMVIEVIVVVEEVVRVVVGAIVDHVPVLTVVVEDILLISVGTYMENLLVLRIRFLIRMTPLLQLLYLGQLYQTLDQLLLHEKSMLSSCPSNRLFHLPSLLLLSNQVLLPPVYCPPLADLGS
ncbi:unnamed protein product [Ilex paraguariensis]|uniref:Secreted protein n=1 Tax=Ilex paraguariensis TaxID=185542 RepID=A0ABC8U9N2_9AQUA